MIIDSSKIGMESARRYHSVNVSAAGYAARSGRGAMDDLFGNFLSAGRDDAEESEKAAKKDSSETKKMIGNQWKAMTNTGRIRSARMRSDAHAMYRLRQQCIMHILDILNGFRHDRQEFEDGLDQSGQSFFGLAEPRPVQLLNTAQYMRQEFSYESEETAFSTKGTVVTADGRTIDFNMDIYMSREFASYYEESAVVQAANYLDPLVINLDVDTASVTDQKFYFDLDADGTKELISGLSSGSGYLALDLNGNGVIDDGNELFGTTSGDGFLDLSKYDEDHNGWIDENDPIFQKLLIWTKDENGNDELYHLKDKGVGALSLARIPTEHSLTNPLDNTANAVIRSTGLFLYENGMVGSMQQLDLANFSKTG